jgi:hypothetical protein
MEEKMSTFVLKREYALQLPNSYVEVDKDEMEYVDGGFYYMDYNAVVGLVQAVGLSSATVTVGALVSAVGGAQMAISLAIPGIGWAAAGIIAANATLFAAACVNAIGERKGIDISLGFPAGLKFTVK